MFVVTTFCITSFRRQLKIPYGVYVKRVCDGCETRCAHKPVLKCTHKRTCFLCIGLCIKTPRMLHSGDVEIENGELTILSPS